MDPKAVDQILQLGLFAQAKPPSDSWLLGTADGEGGATATILLDGDSATVTMVACVPVSDEDRVLTCLLNGTRMVVANLSGIDSESMSLADLATLLATASGKTTPVGADVFSILDSAASGALKQLTLTNLIATLGGSLVAKNNVSASWSPTWGGTGSLTVSNVSGADYATLVLGKLGICWWNADSLQIGGTAGYNSPTVTFPSGWTVSSDAVDNGVCGAFYANTGTAYQAGLVMLDYTNSRFMLAAPTDWSVGTGRQLIGAFCLVPLA